MEEYFKEKCINYISFAHKPLKNNFLKACKEINAKSDKVLVIKTVYLMMYMVEIEIK